MGEWESCDHGAQPDEFCAQCDLEYRDLLRKDITDLSAKLDALAARLPERPVVDWLQVARVALGTSIDNDYELAKVLREIFGPK